MPASSGAFCCKSALKGHRAAGGPEEDQSALEQYYLACANEFEQENDSLCDKTVLSQTICSGFWFDLL